MRLTTKGRFAVTAMIDLTRHQETGPVSLAGISERQDISVAYLEQLFSKLRRKNLVKSIPVAVETAIAPGEASNAFPTIYGPA